MSKTKEYDYYEYFLQISKYVCEGAAYLNETLRTFDSRTFEKRMKKMHEIENSADNVKHEMTHLLAHEFITPIEREDIINLSQELDNIIDDLDDIMRRIYMFHVKVIPTNAIKFSELIVKCSIELRTVLEEFKNFKKSKLISEKIVAVNSLESEGDNLHCDCFCKLFDESNTNTREQLIWSTIYEDMEACLDDCEDVVDIIEEVIMKNS